MRSALEMRLQDDLAVYVDDELAHGLVEQLGGVLDVMLVNGELVRDVDRECVSRPPTGPACLLALCFGSAPCGPRYGVAPTKLARPPIGKPSMITASNTPMSTPSSSAFVATMPSRFPENASASILRRS